MAGYEQYQRVSREIATAVVSGAITPMWAADGTSFEYARDGWRYRYDIAAQRATRLGRDEPARPGAAAAAAARNLQGARPGATLSPTGDHQAFVHEHNLWVAQANGSNPTAATTDGNEAERIHYGTVPWVYTEELRQTTGMWWSPAGTKLAAYRVDLRGVNDYSLTLGQTGSRSHVGVEAYPQPGSANPIVDVVVYDVTTRQTVTLDVRGGTPFDNATVGHYVYHVGWTPDGREVTLMRMNRGQKARELAACSPETGRCRTVVRDVWPTGWVESRPTMRFLPDGRRFLWLSDRTGFRNVYLYDLSGALLATVTALDVDVEEILDVRVSSGTVYYTARDGDNHMKTQLHRVGLDGRDDRRLTDPAFAHTVSTAPDGRHFVDVTETHDRPPASRLMTTDGQLVAEVATSDTTKFERLGLRPVELFTFLGGDGSTTLHGMLHFPSTFDASRRYPLLVTAYAAPETNGATEAFTLPHRLTELGFLVASFDSRGAAGRGKRFVDAVYGRLGSVEVDDQAAGVQALAARPYVDRSRVGIFGTSYGGYVALMALMRYPDVFAAASSSAAVTDWRQYTSVYTERYMGLPTDNAAGYERGSALRLASTLRGRLMLYYGTADENVHPSHTLQLIQALQRAGKSFDVQVGPDLGHTSLNEERMMEFFVEHLGEKAGANAPAF